MTAKSLQFELGKKKYGSASYETRKLTPDCLKTLATLRCTTREEFENGVVTQTHQMFSVHTTVEKFELKGINQRSFNICV